MKKLLSPGGVKKVIVVNTASVLSVSVRSWEIGSSSSNFPILTFSQCEPAKIVETNPRLLQEGATVPDKRLDEERNVLGQRARCNHVNSCQVEARLCNTLIPRDRC